MTTSLPLCRDDLTADWLTEALRAGGRLIDAEVESLEVEPIASGRGFMGQVFRLAPAYRAPDGNLPTSLIAKLPAANPEARNRNAAMWMDRREVYFYRSLARRAPVRTPTCYFADLESEQGAGVLVLEDLTPPCTAYDFFEPASVPHVESCIDTLARLHAHFFDDAQLASLGLLVERCDVLHQAGAKMLTQFWDTFERTAPCTIPSPLKARVQDVASAFARRPSRIRSPSCTLVHGDFWRGNILFDDNVEPGDVYLIDWQILGWGPGSDDLAIFIGMDLGIDQRRDHQDALLSRYHAALVDGAVTEYPIEALRRDFRASLLSCLTVAVISASEIERRSDAESGDPSFDKLREIHKQLAIRLLAAIEDNDALAVLEEDD